MQTAQVTIIKYNELNHLVNKHLYDILPESNKNDPDGWRTEMNVYYPNKRVPNNTDFYYSNIGKLLAEQLFKQPTNITVKKNNSGVNPKKIDNSRPAYRIRVSCPND